MRSLRTDESGTSRIAVTALLMTCALTVPPDGAAGKPGASAYRPDIRPAEFQMVVDNPYHPLVPGTTYSYVERSGGSASTNTIAVTSDSRTILGVSCIAVRDQVARKGVVREETLSWFAQDRQGNVWLFGEIVKEFNARGRLIVEETWEAGVGDAQPGIAMKAKPVVGDSYRQTYVAGAAEDMARIVAVGDTVSVPYGSFERCVKTRDWSLLEPGTDTKWYAPGVGLVRSVTATHEVTVLVSVVQP